MSEVRGSGQECQTVTAQERPRGATPRPRSGAGGGGGTAKRSYSASEVRGGGWEDLPHAPMPEVRGGGLVDQSHVQGAVAARAQEGLEELSHIEGQEGWR